MQPLVIATRNPHKTCEFAQLLGASYLVSDLTAVAYLPPVEETGQTFEENASLKAIAASRAIGGLIIADDSGLEVDALGGAPGVYSARYAGEGATDAENVSKLLAELRRANVAAGDRTARFCCAIAAARAGAIVDVVFGTVAGTITDAPRGAEGFGYDPVFAPTGFDRTSAELGHMEKNDISHRARAIAKLRQRLSSLAAADGTL